MKILNNKLNIIIYNCPIFGGKYLQFKKIMIITIIFISLLAITSVNASETSNGEIINSINKIEDFQLSSQTHNIKNNTQALSFNPTYNTEENDEYDTDFYDKAVLKPTKLITTFNSGKTFNVKVVSKYDKNFKLEDVKLKLRVYTKNSYKDYYAYTNYNGIAKFKVSNIAPGSHKVQIFSADDYTSAGKVTSTIKINKAPTKVSAPKITAKKGKSKIFKIIIKNKANNKAVKNVKISVKIGSKKYNLKTDSHGVATFNTKYLKSGPHKVVIKSKNSKYIINKKSAIVIKSVKKASAKKKSASHSSGGGRYVASVNSNKFHYPSCSAAKRIKSYNKITFSTRSEAIYAGYFSCGICHP